MKFPTPLLALACCCLALPNAQASNAAGGMTAEAALGKLKAGNIRYASAELIRGKLTAERRAATAEGQQPFAIIVGCADSRVPPEIVFDQSIGDLFVVRAAGNLLDEYGLGSIEYAVEHLGTRLIVVLGHERCGAVKAALASDTAPGNIQALVRDIQPAVRASRELPGDPLDNAVRQQAQLMTTLIQRKAHFGALGIAVRIVPAIYDLDTGRVTWLEGEAPAH